MLHLKFASWLIALCLIAAPIQLRADIIDDAHAITRLTILPSFTSTVPATPDPGTTLGRACIFGGGAAVAEDPTGACVGTFRNITPPNPQASVSELLASATATDTLLGGGNKMLTANAIALGTDFSQAEAKDPITVGPVPAIGQLVVSLVLDVDVQSDQTHTASVDAMFGTNLVSTQTLFSLDTTGKNGLAPTVNLQVSPFLTSEGWDQVSLQAELAEALLAGADGSGGFSVTGFALPTITFTVPANTQAQVFGDISGTVMPTPEPSGFVQLVVGIALIGTPSFYLKKHRVK